MAKKNIGVGTKFRSTYADGNPEWTVVRSRGGNSWDCEIKGDEDFKGAKKVFGTEEIEAAVAMAALWSGMKQKHEDYYETLKPGQIVHYHNGFGEYVRCEVVRDDGRNKLKGIALVGAWRTHDLPQRRADGTINLPYNAKKVLEGDLMTPNAGNIWEGSESLQKTQPDPRKMQPLDLSVPPLTDTQAVAAEKWATIKLIRASLEGTDPDTILNTIRALVLSDEHRLVEEALDALKTAYPVGGRGAKRTTVPHPTVTAIDTFLRGNS